MIGVIVNPNSQGNRKNPKRRLRMRRAVGTRGEVNETPDIAAIRGALEGFRRSSRQYWVADGGDGALHWMMNEARETFGTEVIRDDVVWVPTKSGTVDFVAKAIGLRGSGEAIVGRLRQRLDAGETVPTVPVPSLLLEGTQIRECGKEGRFSRLAFGTALGGYGGNFFEPFYAGEAGRGAPRIAALIGAMFATAAARRGFVGPLADRKPRWLTDAEHTFFRPARAEVRIDGHPVASPDGVPVLAHTVLNCASIPLNLGDVLRVFPLAGEGWLHVHAGHVTPIEAFRIFPRLMLGKSVDALLPNAYDRRAQEMAITCLEGTTLTPVLDGELFAGLRDLRISPGPTFRMAVP